jgi:predicted class III extradiol MEMO1 family dioxygenase
MVNYILNYHPNNLNEYSITEDEFKLKLIEYVIEEAMKILPILISDKILKNIFL